MFDTEEFIIAVFCCIDDFLTEITQGHPIRQRGLAPSLTDSEVITMEIVGEFRGHLVISAQGVITSFTLTPANGSEREAVWEVSRLNRKLLAHTVCVWLNRHSLDPLQFEQLIPE